MMKTNQCHVSRSSTGMNAVATNSGTTHCNHGHTHASLYHSRSSSLPYLVQSDTALLGVEKVTL